MFCTRLRNVWDHLLCWHRCFLAKIITVYHTVLHGLFKVSYQNACYFCNTSYMKTLLNLKNLLFLTTCSSASSSAVTRVTELASYTASTPTSALKPKNNYWCAEETTVSRSPHHFRGSRSSSVLAGLSANQTQLGWTHRKMDPLEDGSRRLLLQSK